MNVIRVRGVYVKRSGVFLPRGLAQIKFSSTLNGLGAESPLINVPSFPIPLSHAWEPWLEPGVSKAQYPKEVRKVHERLQA